MTFTPSPLPFPQTSARSQAALCLALARMVYEQFKEKAAALELCRNLLPPLIAAGDSYFGSTWLSALHAPLPKRWRQVVAAVVAEAAVKDEALLKSLMAELLQAEVAAADWEKLEQVQIALGQAIALGRGEFVAAAILSLSPDAIPKNRLTRIGKLIRELAALGDDFAPSQQQALADWLMAMAEEQLSFAIASLDALAVNSGAIERQFGQLLARIFPALEAGTLNTLLKNLVHVPPQLESLLQALAPNSKEARQALIRFYRRQALTHNNPTAGGQLLQFCTDNSRNAALQASRAVLELGEVQQLPFPPLLAVITEAQHLGVRSHCLKALMGNLEAGWMLGESELETLCRAIAAESLPEIVQPLYNIVDLWVDARNCVPFGVVEVVLDLTERLIREKPGAYLDGGLANAAFVTLKHLVNLNEERLMPRLGCCARQLLKGANINRSVDRLYVIGLLARLGRFDPQFLVRIVREDLNWEEGTMPMANQCAVVVAIIYSYGKQALLLDEMLQGDEFAAEVKACIIRERET